jgi:tetratricopeptide (TPR) repeat protein
MDSQTLRTRFTDLSKALAEIEVSSDMAPRIRVAVAGQLDIMAADAERNLVPDAKTSTDPDVRDDGARFFRQLAMTNSWLDGRDDITRKWIDRAAELASNQVLQDMLRNEQNSLRDNEAFAGIYALCQAGRVDQARRQLVARRKSTTDPITRKRIDEILADPRNLMGPLNSLPSLQTINGFGTMMHGSRDRGSDGTYVATLCVTVLFIPLLPLRAYVVRSEGDNSWRFFGRVPLSPFAFWYRRVLLTIPLLFALGVWGVGAWETSPYITEKRHYAAAQFNFDRKDYAGSLRIQSPETRSARMDALAVKALTAALNDIKDAPTAGAFLATSGTSASRLKLPWPAETLAAAEAAFGRITDGKAARDFLSWFGAAFPKAGSSRADMAAKLAETSIDPSLLALTADLFWEAKRPCPPEILARLKGLLLRMRHQGWSADTLSYLRVADPAQATPVLLARCELVWKGKEQAADLLDLPHLPPQLRALITLDLELNPEKRAAGLEKAADPAGLEDPQKAWHRLGAARRLLQTYGSLNEKDPIKYPVTKMRPWAIEAAELAPEDPETRVTALRYLLEDGEFDKVISIGSPATNNDSKTATLVGIALARSGKPEEAANLLRPLVARDLPTFTNGLAKWEKAFNDKTASVWKTLENGTAPRFVLTRLNSLPKDKVQHEADKWVREQVERDAHVMQLGKIWREKLDIHPAASELAMVELSLGRALPPGPRRQARLEEAERLFLELRKTAQDDPHQEMQLGQVYFWLGKDKEGAEIFKRLEETGDPKVLHQLGHTYRNLSRMDAARRVLEAAYAKAENALQKNAIALTRSMSTDDFHDRLAWLKKCEPKDEHTRMEIDQTEAWIDITEGNYAEAAPALKRVAAYYANLPESPTSLNNGSIALQELAKATGDLKHQLEGVRLMRRAFELQPEDAIILGNYVSDLQRIGISALSGSALRADLLHEIPNHSWMDFVVPRLSPQEWIAKVKAQPELRRSAELAPKVVILSPDNLMGYSGQGYYLSLIQDASALKKLRESVELKPPARQEQAEDAKRYARGEYTENEKKSAEKSLATSEAQLARIRKENHPATLAYSLTRTAGLRVRAIARGVGTQKLETAAREIEEAVQVFDAPPTRHSLSWVRMEQAAADVAASDKEFARWVKGNPSLDAGTVLPIYVIQHPDLAAAIQGRESVRKAAAACADAIASGARNPSIACWSFLEMAGHEARDAARKALATHPTYLESRRLDVVLNPYTPDDVLDAWLTATACREKAVAEGIAARAKANGVIPLFFK